MAGTKKNKTKTKKTAEPAAQAFKGDKPARVSGARINRLQLVRRMIRQCMILTEKTDTTTKSVVAELIRLIGLEKELAEETEAIREIKVTWVEPTEAGSSKST